MMHIDLRLAILLCALFALAATAGAAVLPIGPTRIPFYTGNLSVHAFMRYWGTFTGETVPASDWASPEHIEQLRRIGVFADCDYQAWCLAEPERGKWDFGLYEKNADLLHEAGFEYIFFAWVHFPPKWFIESPEFVPYECAEHGEKLIQLSPWAPNVWDIYRRFYAAQHKAMGDKVDWIRIATPSDYGEIGYPAAMTSWLVPQEHAHRGYWCGDQYARQDFRDSMKHRFRTLAALNERWGTDFAAWDDVTYPELDKSEGARVARDSGKSTDRRRWLDFIEWYNGVWLEFVPRLVSLMREFYPDNPMIVSVGYASEDLPYGNDYSAVCKMAKSAGVALQTPGNVHHYAMKRVSTACHFYGAPYYTEPPGDVPPEDEITRVFHDISNGMQVYFEYPQNLDRVRPQMRAYKNYMTGAQPMADVALFNPTIEHRLTARGGFPEHVYDLGNYCREYCEYDVIDERMVIDGALDRYRVLAYVQGSVTEASSLRAIRRWVERGGALFTCDLGTVETVEGDASIWHSMMPATLATLAEVRIADHWDWNALRERCTRRVGRGIVIQIPVKPDNPERLAAALSHVNHNLRGFGAQFTNAPLIDGEMDGIAATLLPERILYFTWLETGVSRTIDLREDDWARRERRPESLRVELNMKPFTIVEVPLVQSPGKDRTSPPAK